MTWKFFGSGIDVGAQPDIQNTPSTKLVHKRTDPALLLHSELDKERLRAQW